MAAPHNLTLHASFSSSQQQSLQTPDSNTLFSSSFTPISQSLSDVSSVNTLEELLSFSGVTNDTQNDVGHLKRHLDDVKFTDSSVSKRAKLDDEVHSVQQTHPQSHIPSILPHTTNSVSPPFKLQTKSGMILPLVNPLTSVAHTSTSGVNRIHVPTLLNSSSSNSIESLTTDSNSSSNTANNESVALMVQLYKHYQSVGDSVGMSKVHEHLLALHSQLASKAGTYLNNLANVNSTGQSIVSSTNQPQLAVTKIGQVLNSTAGSTNTLTKKPVTVNPLITSTAYSTSNNQFKTLLNNQAAGGLNPLSTLPFTINSIPSIQNMPSVNALSTTTTTTTTTSTNTNTMHGINNLIHSTTNSAIQSSVSSQLQFLPTGLNASQVKNPSLLNLTTLKQTNESGGLIPPTAVTGFQTNPTSTNVLSSTIPQPINTRSLSSTTTVASQMSSPSIVTHSLSSSIPSTGLPLTGLQVTAQTQANVLRAVYSYRLQQIQDFLASLPAGQRPTTTQELRDLLTKHNILAKALPADFVANIQKQLPIVSSSGAQSITTTNPVATQSSGVQSHVNTTSSTTLSATNVTSTPGLLPGVTLETLRTLCRLPEAELVRIPMPSMLLTVVQYMRAKKWNGNSTELPSLIQQAQEALAKGTLIAATPQPPFQANSTVKTSTQSMQQPLKVTSTINNQQKTNTSSPLSQYMASVGIKLPSSTNNTDISNKLAIKSTLTVSKQTTQQTLNSRPATRYHNKTLQEQAEKERLSALQKVLQSSEEARIAFRFQAHLDKLHQQINSCEIQRPFSTWHDLILRLLPYHIYREPELPQGAMEKADAVYEGIAGVLLSRGQGLMNQYQQILLREEHRISEDECASLVLQRLWLDGERERIEEEERQKKEAEEIAAELSAVGRTSNDSFFDSDPFLLESNSSYLDDSFLDNFWSELNDGLGDTDFDLGIT